MNDNMRPNRTVEVSDILESKNTERMEWLTDSSDLNTIEHAWDALGRRVLKK